MKKDLRRQVCRANKLLGVSSHLATLRWGNVSAVDRDEGVMVIKPSGVPFKDLRQKDMVIVSLETGQPIFADTSRPSTNAAAHIGLYKAFPGISAICHTHSLHATMFAQACCPIPCLGATHAYAFYGDVPVTRLLAPEEAREDYDGSTARAIAECFEYNNLNPLEVPGVLVAGHGPFTFGKDAAEALEHSIVLEASAEMAIGTKQINPHVASMPQCLLDKHYFSKHGSEACGVDVAADACE